MRDRGKGKRSKHPYRKENCLKYENLYPSKTHSSRKYIHQKKKEEKKSDAYFKLKICHQEYQMRILARLSIYSHSALNPSIRMIRSARLHKVFQFYKVELMK